MDALTSWSGRLLRREITMVGNLKNGTRFNVTGQVVYTAISLISIMILSVLLSKYTECTILFYSLLNNL